MMGTTTIDNRALVDDAEAVLAEAGVETPRRDAELLLAHVLKLKRPELIAGFASPAGAPERRRFGELVVRRAAREPLAYITGTKGFRAIELFVDRRVLVPRPETELLVEVVKAARPSRILDVATGSGAVALALADELPECDVLATDSSTGALAVAAGNASALGLDGRVRFSRHDLLNGVDGSFDAIAANLPYVVASEIDTLQPEISCFEPRAALDGGADGLDLVRRLARAAPQRLKLGGLIALEIGDTQGAAAIRILQAAGFTGAEIHQDLAGRDRVVAARTAR